MTQFDAERTRELARRLLDAEQGVEREHYVPDAVGNAAVLGLGGALTAWIAGLQEESRPVVERCRRWLEDSRARDERFGEPPAYFAARRDEALAVARWLLSGEEPASLWREALELHERAWDDLPDDHREPAFMREHYLADFARDGRLAGRCEHVLTVCARFGARPVASASDVATELDLALWACREPAPAELSETGGRVVRDRIGDWLSRGDGIRAAIWLKLVYWTPGGPLTPAATLARGWTLATGS